VTTTVRHEEFPAKSFATIVTRLIPNTSGTCAMLQLVVPAAVPEYPMLVLHVTLAIPPVSAAVPLKAREAPLVERDVIEGFTIVRPGGVTSCGPGVGKGAGVGAGAGVGVGAGVGAGLGDGAGVADAAAYNVKIAFRSSAASPVAIR
jgi:hypothetical protein